MPIYAETKIIQRELPRTGTFRSICCGVWDLGYVDDTFNGDPKISRKVRIAWEIDQRMKGEGEYKDKRFVLTTKPMTLSLGDKANLTKLLHSVLGKELSEDERKAFDLETLVGTSCYVAIAHEKAKSGNDYAFINSYIPLPEGIEPMISEVDWANNPPKWIQKEITEGMTIQDRDSEALKAIKAQAFGIESPKLKEEVAEAQEAMVAEIFNTSTEELVNSTEPIEAVEPLGIAEFPDEPETTMSNPTQHEKIQGLFRLLKKDVLKTINDMVGKPKEIKELTYIEAQFVIKALENSKGAK